MLKTKNQKVSLILIIFSIFYLILSFQLPPYPYVPVDSDAVPIALGFILIALSVALYFSKDDKESEEEKEKRKMPKEDLLVLLIVTAMVLIYIALLEMLGFLLSTALFVFICTWYLGYKRHLVNLLVSVLFPLAVYYLFTAGLHVSLPQGVLPF